VIIRRRSKIRILEIAIILLTILTACSRNNQSNSVEKISEQYKQNHDYESLVSLLPYLNTFKMLRTDVEQLLGQPSYCPTTDSCYYPSNKMIETMCGEGSKPHGDVCRAISSGEEVPPLRFSLILVVKYKPLPNQTLPDASDPLTWFWLSPVGE